MIAIIRRSPREPGRHGGTPSPARDVTGPAEARTRCRCRRLLAPAGWERARRGSRVPPAASAPPAPAEQPRSEGPARGWRLPASSRSATGRTRPSPGARACHCSVEPDTSSEPQKGWAGALVPSCPWCRAVPVTSPCVTRAIPQSCLGRCALGRGLGPVLAQHPFIECSAVHGVIALLKSFVFSRSHCELGFVVG